MTPRALVLRAADATIGRGPLTPNQERALLRAWLGLCATSAALWVVSRAIR